jgi:hypothetical protein
MTTPVEVDNSRRILSYTLGIDLGQSQDYTAIALIEQEIGSLEIVWEGTGGNYREVEFTKEHFIYNVVGLKRLPLGTSYPDQVKEVENIFKRIQTAGKGLARNDHQAKKHLAIDRSGCGRPITDLFEQAGLSPTGITITGGDQVVQDGAHFRVPKRELVNLVKVLLQQGRLKISTHTPDYRILISEMNNFTYKINDNANDVYGATSGTHDDLLLALAVGLWVAERQVNNEFRQLGPGDEVYDMLTNYTGF